MERIEIYMSNRIDSSWFVSVADWMDEYQNCIETILSIYPQSNLKGLNFRIHRDNSTQTIRCCFPRIQDLLTPFRKITLDKVRVVLVCGEPMSNGISSSIPFYYNNEFYPQHDLKDPVKISPAIHVIEDWINASTAGNQLPRTPIGNDSVLGFNPYDWIKQGVLPLHASWTVEEGCPLSNEFIWYDVMERLLVSIQKNKPETIFIIMGDQAAKVARGLTDDSKIVNVPDPYDCFKEKLKGNTEYQKSNPFLITNGILEMSGKKVIYW